MSAEKVSAIQLHEMSKMNLAKKSDRLKFKSLLRQLAGEWTSVNEFVARTPCLRGCGTQMRAILQNYLIGNSVIRSRLLFARASHVGPREFLFEQEDLERAVLGLEQTARDLADGLDTVAEWTSLAKWPPFATVEDYCVATRAREIREEIENWMHELGYVESEAAWVATIIGDGPKYKVQRVYSWGAIHQVCAMIGGANGAQPPKVPLTIVWSEEGMHA